MENHQVRVVWECSAGHRHEMCRPASRGLPPELRCAATQDPGYGQGGGGCALPAGIDSLVERELRDNFQESKRRGYVLLN